MEQIVRVLVVEDERAFLLDAVKKIEETDNNFCVIETAINGLDALEKVECLKPDVIFTDVKMPLMDGVELLKKLREDNNDIPVVIVSGFSDYGYLKQAVTLSATDYLLKPLRKDELIPLLNRIKLDLKGKFLFIAKIIY